MYSYSGIGSIERTLKLQFIHDVNQPFQPELCKVRSALYKKAIFYIGCWSSHHPILIPLPGSNLNLTSDSIKGNILRLTSYCSLFNNWVLSNDFFPIYSILSAEPCPNRLEFALKEQQMQELFNNLFVINESTKYARQLR